MTCCPLKLVSLTGVPSWSGKVNAGALSPASNLAMFDPLSGSGSHSSAQVSGRNGSRHWYNSYATAGMGLVSRGRYLFLWLAQGPAGQQRERDMTIEALSGAHAGTSDRSEEDTSE